MRLDLPIVIVGAGIGGLTAAHALLQRGFQVVVLERAEDLRPRGSGIVMQANAMEVFSRLGLSDRVRAAGAALQSVDIRHWQGRALAPLDLAPLVAEVGHPVVAVHRARLHAALREGLTVRTGCAVTGYVDDADGVVVHLSSGEDGRGGLLVGADGLHSVVRAQLAGDGPTRYSGYTSWRGIAAYEGGVHSSESWGPGQRFGLVPIGHGETYWFATANAPAGGRDEPDSLAAVKARFSGWHDPIGAVLAATTQVLRTDIADRAPLTTWVDGRVALLGDAAHAMTPNFGQGGCQAVEDAWVLARALAEAADVRAGLARYQGERVARANGVVEGARRFGAVGQWENAALRWLRDAVVSLTPQSVTRAQVLGLMRFPG